MRAKLMGIAAVGTSLLVATAYVASVRATPAAGFSGTTIAVGQFADIDVSNHTFFPAGFQGSQRRENWLSFQKTKGPSDLYVQSNVWVPGGSTGWHTHPGHSLIIVTAGTVTAYDGDDPSCTSRTYTVGMGFVDEGGDHVHLLRNEGAVEARTIAVQLIPAGATRRIDAAGPAGCGL